MKSIQVAYSYTSAIIYLLHYLLICYVNLEVK